jgi:hypothetical protein
MNITKLDAAKAQVATAIWLYFEDRDPISVHTLVVAAGEIIDRICDSKGTLSMRSGLLARIVPDRRKEVIAALNKAANFFKHASSSKPNQVLKDFSDDRNLLGILMAADGLRLLSVEMVETRMFAAWVAIVEPHLMLVSPPKEFITAVFGDIGNQPRAEQKKSGRDALHYELTGTLPGS